MNYGDDNEDELAEAFVKMHKVLSRDYTIFDGIVSGDVNENALTCTVKVGDSQSEAIFTDVSIEVLKTAGLSVTSIPNVGSAVLMCCRDGTKDRPQILKVFSAAKIYINPTTLTQFGKGENGGLVLVNPLVTQLNGPEKDLNELKDLIASWVPAPGDGGAALKTILTQWFAIKIPVTVADNIQSKVITQ